MAFWGAPLADPAHARHAIQAGLSMVEAVEALADPFRARGWPPIHIGVGLSTGPMNVGNMGSSFRMAYTVLGDTVNLGSRLEGLTKQYGVTIIVSAATRAAVPDMAFRELDRVRVKGKLEPVAIYEPLGERDALDPKVLADVDAFTEVLEHYRCQRWDEAEAGIAALAERVPLRIYAIYRERIEHFRAHPPGEAWDGVFTHESK
jgi:adenylate cyclase